MSGRVQLCIAALQLRVQLGLGSYKSAWLLAAKLRRAMVAPARALLAGLVEVDETTIPLRRKDDPPAGGHGAATGARCWWPAPSRCTTADRAGCGSARSTTRRPKACTLSSEPMSKPAPPPGPTAGPAIHEPHVLGPMAAHLVLPWMHRVFANLKRWALGVYHGLRHKHLHSYLDEFAFRFNRRHTRH